MDIERRAHIIAMVDAQECGDCGKPIPDGAAMDAGWFIDSKLDSEGTEMATIRCPNCW